MSRSAIPPSVLTRPVVNTVAGRSQWRRYVFRKPKPGTLVLFAYLLVTFILTHINLSGTFLDHHHFPAQFQMADKVYHFVAYGALTFLVMFAYTNPCTGNDYRDRLASAQRVLMLCLLVLVYGIFDEATQPMFGRRFEVLDLLANAFGVAAGQLTFVLVEAFGWRRKMLQGT